MKKYLEVVLNIPLNQTFTYIYVSPENENPLLLPETGKRAELRFGNQKKTGFITNVYDSLPENCPVTEDKIRNITRIIDKEPLFNSEIYEIAKWISKFYLCSIGEAVFSIIPSGRRESSENGFSFESELSFEKQNSLSAEQLQAVQSITQSSKSKKAEYHYIYGPTGTGKTEVFLSAASKILETGKGVIYLVPEISLTQQVIEAVVKRFGNTAAVLHSGLTPSQKLAQWKKIMHRECRIVIGARSAVFAPVPDLGLIIIDEEHDGSYKSHSTPRFHARQAAMFRVNILGIPLVMGSATPSVEAWKMMSEKKIHSHILSKRLAGGSMPTIKVIDLSKTNSTGCISYELAQEIRNTLDQKKQSILFLNRRGFTHFFRCQSCGFELSCKNCSVPMTFHKNENRLRCHYCGWSVQPPQVCPKCSSLDVGYSGFGTEFIEAETRAKFPSAKVLRIDTDSLTKKGELQEKLEAFKKGDYDIMLGTQMVAKGLNFPKLQLVGVIMADTGLHMPDFRASERTFSLITQVAGRAGRYFPDGKVFVQTYNPLREPIRFACSHDIKGFYEYELDQRKMLGFPPFSRLIRLVFRSSSLQMAASSCEHGANIIRQALGKEGYILGPSECPILKIAMNFRYQIILCGQNIRYLQEACNVLLNNYTHPQSVYIECDVDPTSLL